MSLLRLAVAGALLVAGPAAAQSTTDVPRTVGFVVDGANAIPDDVQRRVEQRLTAHQRRTTNEVVVMTIPTTGGLAIEQFAKQVFNTLGIGRKDRNNGVLIVLAMQDRKLRIQVGTGLESRITNAEAKTIVDGRMVPALKVEDPGRAVTAGVEGVLTELGDPAPIADDPAPDDEVPGGAGVVDFPTGPELHDFDDVARGVTTVLPFVGLLFVGVFVLIVVNIVRGVGGAASACADATHATGYGRGVWFGSGRHAVHDDVFARPSSFGSTDFGGGSIGGGGEGFGGGSTSGGGASGSW